MGSCFEGWKTGFDSEPDTHMVPQSTTRSRYLASQGVSLWFGQQKHVMLRATPGSVFWGTPSSALGTMWHNVGTMQPKPLLYIKSFKEKEGR